LVSSSEPFSPNGRKNAYLRAKFARRQEQMGEKDTRGGGIGLQSVAASAEKALSCRIAILGGKHRPV